jgi:hypothetical protein
VQVITGTQDSVTVFAASNVAFVVWQSNRVLYYFETFGCLLFLRPNTWRLSKLDIDSAFGNLFQQETLTSLVFAVQFGDWRRNGTT